MDCVRVSTRELEGEEYMGVYDNIKRLKELGADACRQACVTDLNCKAWKYNPEGECLVSSRLHGHYPTYRVARPGTRSGLIECAQDWNMLKLILMILILGSVLVLVWYLMNKGESRRGQGSTFFPRFHFTGPKN